MVIARSKLSRTIRSIYHIIITAIILASGITSVDSIMRTSTRREYP